MIKISLGEERERASKRAARDRLFVEHICWNGCIFHESWCSTFRRSLNNYPIWRTFTVVVRYWSQQLLSGQQTNFYAQRGRKSTSSEVSTRRRLFSPFREHQTARTRSSFSCFSPEDFCIITQITRCRTMARGVESKKSTACEKCKCTTLCDALLNQTWKLLPRAARCIVWNELMTK